MMKNSAFLCDYLKEQNQLGALRPDSMIDRRNPDSGGDLVQIKSMQKAAPNPVIDQSNPGGGKMVQITSTGDTAKAMQTTNVPKRNLWILVGAGVLSVTIIYWIFNRNE